MGQFRAIRWHPMGSHGTAWDLIGCRLTVPWHPIENPNSAHDPMSARHVLHVKLTRQALKLCISLSSVISLAADDKDHQAQEEGLQRVTTVFGL